MGLSFTQALCAVDGVELDQRERLTIPALYSLFSFPRSAWECIRERFAFTPPPLSPALLRRMGAIQGEPIDNVDEPSMSLHCRTGAPNPIDIWTGLQLKPLPRTTAPFLCD